MSAVSTFLWIIFNFFFFHNLLNNNIVVVKETKRKTRIYGAIYTFSKPFEFTFGPRSFPRIIHTAFGTKF